ncbi:MAG: hypothetical protein CMJ31_09040 [Phycisphaerae bacterium]|nr:hypothetical protein [Phycisphaerae bacterium]
MQRYLRDRGTPFIAVDQGRRATARNNGSTVRSCDPPALKTFDLVVYRDPAPHALVEVKSRRVSVRGGRVTRRECWVTLEDVESLIGWQTLFGQGFQAIFAFVYPLVDPLNANSLGPSFVVDNRSFGLLTIGVDDYRREMRVRSHRWRTVDLPQDRLDDLSRPLIGPSLDRRDRPQRAPGPIGALEPTLYHAPGRR